MVIHNDGTPYTRAETREAMAGIFLIGFLAIAGLVAIGIMEPKPSPATVTQSGDLICVKLDTASAPVCMRADGPAADPLNLRPQVR